MAWWGILVEYFTPDSLHEDLEAVRRTQLMVGLALLGLVLGGSYGVFYWTIGHYWGAAVIGACIFLIICVPFLIRSTGEVSLGGNMSLLVWSHGFAALAATEGGIHGHAVSWLACGGPLLALLILNRFTALIWCGICFLIVVLFGALELAGIPVPRDYPVCWHRGLLTASILGLVIFMSLLGILFEYARKQAVLNMQAAVAERRRTEEAKQAAEESSRAKDQFLAMLSHELRTPLTPVLAVVTGIDQPNDLTPEVLADMEMIHRNVQLEAKLIDDLLDVTRISSGKIVLNLAVIDAHSCLRSAVEICRKDIEAKELQVSLRLEAVEHHVKADPVRLRQVFWNLLRNALKFTPPKGRLSLRCSNNAGWLRIEITDTGIGIEPEVLPRIFNAFEQGGQTKTLHFGGLGLGLSIAKGIIELHHGQLTAFSEGKDKGATFTVELPTVAPALNTLPLPTAQTPSKAKPSRILLVEDDGDTLRTLSRLLQRCGYGVTTADRVQKGLEISATERFDIIISDLGLPDGSGLDLMRRMKQLYALPGIALSGYGSEEDIRQSHAAGFELHLVKPVNFDALRTAIKEVALT